MALKSGYLKKAIEEAENSDIRNNFNHGAVIFNNSQFFGSGNNRFRHVGFIPSRYLNYRDSLHAEISAIRNVPNWECLKGASILIIRIDKQGNLRMARPCSKCTKSLKHFGFSTVYYSTQEGLIIKKRVRQL